MRDVGPPCTSTTRGGSSPSGPAIPARPGRVQEAVHRQPGGVGPRPGPDRGDVVGGSSGDVTRTGRATRSVRPTGPAHDLGQPVDEAAAQRDLAVDGLEAGRRRTPRRRAARPSPVRASSTPSRAPSVVPPAHAAPGRRRGPRGRPCRAPTAGPAWSALASVHGDRAVHRRRGAAVHQPDCVGQRTTGRRPARTPAGRRRRRRHRSRRTASAHARRGVRVARSSAVESQGMLGWSHATQASDRAVGRDRRARRRSRCRWRAPTPPSGSRRAGRAAPARWRAPGRGSGPRARRRRGRRARRARRSATDPAG